MLRAREPEPAGSWGGQRSRRALQGVAGRLAEKGGRRESSRLRKKTSHGGGGKEGEEIFQE